MVEPFSSAPASLLGSTLVAVPAQPANASSEGKITSTEVILISGPGGEDDLAGVVLMRYAERHRRALIGLTARPRRRLDRERLAEIGLGTKPRTYHQLVHPVSLR